MLQILMGVTKTMLINALRRLWRGCCRYQWDQPGWHWLTVRRRGCCRYRCNGTWTMSRRLGKKRIACLTCANENIEKILVQLEIPVWRKMPICFKSAWKVVVCFTYLFSHIYSFICLLISAMMNICVTLQYLFFFKPIICWTWRFIRRSVTRWIVTWT